MSSRIASVESIELADPRKRRRQGDRGSCTTRPLSPRGAVRQPGRGLKRTAALRARLVPKADIRQAGRCLLLAAVGLWGLGGLLPAVWAGNASGVEKVPSDLTALSLEQLSTIKVTSVSKKEQDLAKAAAAIYVITQEDLRRSGATSIPEALRMVPGVQVAQIDANKWAVSARGFNGRFANKLLVLIDGRSVYTLLFSGVYWDMHDLMLEDIDRIEVIRGPGATMWGSNAVNGVINIITKHTRDTQGALLTSGTGNQEQGFGALRYGAKVGENLHYRVYTRYFNRDSFVTPDGLPAQDGWRNLHSGFRLDWQGADRDSVSVQGSVFDGQSDQTIRLTSLQPPLQRSVHEPIRPSGGHLLGRWDHGFSDTSDMALQLYYDRSKRGDAVGLETHDTFDVDFQHRWALGARHELLWGSGYRGTTDQIEGTFDVSFNPASRGVHLFSAFVQDEWDLLDDRLTAVVGARLENNSYSGFEMQPNLRLLWSPHARHTGWASIARAVRSPSRSNRDIRINFAAFPQRGSTTLLSIFGDPDFESENLLAYEMGYRFQSSKRFSLDVATFFNSYGDLVTSEPDLPFFEVDPAPAHLVIPFRFGNQMSGETYGVETAANFRLTDYWKLSASYSWLEMQLHRDASSRDADAEAAEGESPTQQFQVRSYLNLPWKLQLDSSLYFVGSLPELSVPGYTRVDTRIGWRPHRRLDLDLVLQNLLDDRHLEFFAFNLGIQPAEVRRSFYGKMTWRF